MSVCLNGLRSGPICFGSLMDRMHGRVDADLLTSAAILGVVALAFGVFFFRRVP